MQMHIFVNDCAQESSTQTKFMAQHEAHEASLRSLRSALQVEVEAARRQEAEANARAATMEKEIHQLQEKQVLLGSGREIEGEKVMGGIYYNCTKSMLVFMIRVK